MKYLHVRVLLVFLALAAASLACNFPASGGAPTSAPTQPPLSAEEAQQLEEQLQATLAAPGEVNLTITEQQINAYMIAQLAGQDEQLISNPSVELTSGQMNIYGQVNQAGITVNTKITLQPRVDENGDPKLDVVSMDLGGLPVPQALSDRVDAMVNNALDDYLSANSGQFKVSSITVVEDQMTVTGTNETP